MFDKQNSASLNFMLSASLWVVLGTLMGLVLALEFVFPDMFQGVPWLVFGRLRQAHTNTVMFAWLSMGMMGAWYYIVPKLTGRRIWSEKLGNVCMLLWNAAMLLGIASILNGNTQSREYAELPWIVDVGVMIVLLLNLLNIYMTIAHRVEKKLYVSLWYITGTVIWMPILYFIGNVMWNVPAGASVGINDSFYNWFYGHNVLGLWFTTGLLPVIYYLIPLDTRTPLYSHVLSLVGFWGIIFFYTGVGAHHLLWSPIPYWLKTFGVAESIGMVIPVLAIMMNIFLTMRGNWNRFFSSIPLRFAVTGWAAYVLVSYQGSHQSLRAINNLTHFTQYVPGHAHLALMFFAASTVMGGIFYIMPRILGRGLYSRALVNVQYSVYFIGFLFFFGGFFLTGIVQGSAWIHQGLPIWSVLPGLRPFMALRAIGGVLVVISFILFSWNVLLTYFAGKPIVEPGLPVAEPGAGQEVAS
ncbi:cbb3-type cytochrome c oxidase subunit I [Paucidesulfovibrio longus]|uniref:cbb3-type cytochrome c oxidase subunit I n=1 Tax=Paucidesulfovibrio longus TaxID=889 RepID=UPI0003B41D46|nr:cbb3-type cytochrome c oxidase subunit I [Paucidesulfovibrio longus]